MIEMLSSFYGTVGVNGRAADTRDYASYYMRHYFHLTFFS